ncbi:MAG: (d)CMP kinase [Candidatus Pacearchaeota archaeon]
MKKKFSIAIDGPVGSGKGTLAVALAKKFNALYINTGAMYRALTLLCLRKNLDIRDEEEILRYLKNCSIEIRTDRNNKQKIFLNGEDVSREIFLPEITRIVAYVSAFPKIRKEMVKRQKEIASKAERAIIEGRDIATDVAPNAELKIFLIADLNIRVQRRLQQLKKNGINSTFEEVLKETQERDRRDTERQASPLTRVPDAYVLDTTNLSIEETVEQVVKKMKERNIIDD